jgi:hypothetical protein
LRILFLSMLLALTIVGAVMYVTCFEDDTTDSPSSQEEADSAWLRQYPLDGGPSPRESILGPDGEEVVFQVHHANFAWARVSRGFFINRRGEVRRFDSFDSKDHERAPLALPPTPRHGDLLKSYGQHPEVVSVLPAAEVAAYQALAQAARDAPLVCGQTAEDMGGTGYQAWVMGRDGVYSSIRLGGEGDISCRSLSPAGARVKRWLQKVTGMASHGHGLPARDCKAPPCARGEDCFSVTYCKSVPNCGWCDGSTVCVEGPDGGKHCSFGYHSQCNEDSCRCFGHVICPGGDSDCRQASGGALTCRRP